VLPSDQPDFLTATKFINVLIKAGVVVHRATAPFSLYGKSYPAGSYVVKTAQPFRAHVMDMFEPQDHPDDIPYPGGPPRPPYDVTGYNLSYSMGVKYDRLLDAFDGPFEKLVDVVKPPSPPVEATANVAGYFLSHEVNDAFIAVNRLLKAGDEIYWTKEAITVSGRAWPAGTMFIPAKSSTLPLLQQLAAEKGLNFAAVASRPSGELIKLNPVRIGLWDTYGGSVTSGWTRWLLEQYEFPFQVVFAKALDAGDLTARFDVLIFPDGAIPMRDSMGGGQPNPASIPAEFRDRLGNVTISRTVPELKKFVESGGTLLAIGSSTSIGYHFGLPIHNALVERSRATGLEVPLPSERFYVPGAIVEARVDSANPLAYGLEPRANVFFDNSPAFRLLPDAGQKGVKAVAWIDSPKALRSGWAWGQQYMDQTSEIIDAPLGRGRLVLFGPEIVWRAQPHGTFKFLFNGIYLGSVH
jgi:hypothetical protein